MSKKVYLPFVEVKPISELPEVTTLSPGGSILVEQADGTSKRISTEAFYQILNNIARPITPSDTPPTTANRWYKPTTSSDDPGTNYPNAGNLKAKSGFDSLFWYDGTSWTKTEVQLPGIEVASEFDEDDTEKAQSGKTINDELIKRTKLPEFIKINPSLKLANYYINYAVIGNIYGPTPAGGWSIWEIQVTDFESFKLFGSLVNSTGKLIGVDADDKVTEIFTTTNKHYNGELFTITNTATKKLVVATKDSGVLTYIEISALGSEIYGTEKLKLVYDNSTIFQSDPIDETPVPTVGMRFAYDNPKGSNISNAYAVSWNNMYLFTVQPNQLISYNGYFTQDDGISLLDVNKNKIALWKVGVEGNYNPGTQIIETIDSNELPSEVKYIVFSAKNTAPFMLKTTSSNKVLYPAQEIKEKFADVDQQLVNLAAEIGSGGGGSDIFDQSIYLWNKGLRENNTSSQNTAIINAAILEARNDRKSIYFPEGKFKVDNIQYYPVNMYGKDRNTMLYSTQAVPMFNMVGNSGGENVTGQNTNFPGVEMCGFVLSGSLIGTKGFNFGSPIAWCKFDRIVFSGFTDAAIDTHGMLVCDWTNIHIDGCGYGIRSVQGQYQGLGYRTNLVTFTNIRIGNISKYGIIWDGGAGIHIQNLDAEFVGTTNDADSGVIWYKSVAEYTNGVGLTLVNSWSERCDGAFFLKIDSTGSHSIRDTYIEKTGATNTCIINNSAKLIIDGSHISGFTTDILTNGANSKTYVNGTSIIGAHVETNEGQYKVATYS